MDMKLIGSVSRRVRIEPRYENLIVEILTTKLSCTSYLQMTDMTRSVNIRAYVTSRVCHLVTSEVKERTQHEI